MVRWALGLVLTAAIASGLAACAVVPRAAPNAATKRPPIFPSEVLTLQRFKLTLPIGEPLKPREIKQPALASYQDAEFFFLDSTKTGVVFTAPCGGVTTQGSNYPRSELREMTADYQRAAWSADDGRHVMTLRQAVTHLPAVRPQVIAGQIHDTASDMMAIRLDGKKLFIDHAGGPHGPTLTDDYHLGDVFTVEIVVENGHVKTSYNGRLVDDYPTQATGCYFKAGCYTQSNVSRGDQPDAYAQVVIYDLAISP